MFEIKSGLPEAAGTKTVLSHMAAQGIRIPNGHLRVYRSLVRIDAVATTQRWNPVTRRRQYWVPGMYIYNILLTCKSSEMIHISL